MSSSSIHSPGPPVFVSDHAGAACTLDQARLAHRVPRHDSTRDSPDPLSTLRVCGEACLVGSAARAG